MKKFLDYLPVFNGLLCIMSLIASLISCSKGNIDYACYYMTFSILNYLMYKL